MRVPHFIHSFFHNPPCFIRLVLFLIVTTILYRIAKYYLANKKKHELTKDSTILITGGCQGLGKELVKKFASEHKCKIIVWDINTNLAPEICK